MNLLGRKHVGKRRKKAPSRFSLLCSKVHVTPRYTSVLQYCCHASQLLRRRRSSNGSSVHALSLRSLLGHVAAGRVACERAGDTNLRSLSVLLLASRQQPLNWPLDVRLSVLGPRLEARGGDISADEGSIFCNSHHPTSELRAVVEGRRSAAKVRALRGRAVPCCATLRG